MTAEAFAEVCKALPYRRKGMFYSEVFLFLQACERQRVATIVESGVKFGMSTALLRAGFAGELISIDKDGAALLDPINDVDFIHGDSRDVIPQVLKESKGRRIGVLIDGPKGKTAAALMRETMRWPNVRLVAIHDAPRAAGETSHSHDPAFRAAVGRSLDALIQHDYARKYPDGPGLAIWEKNQ